MYIVISLMIFTFSIRDFGHSKFLKSQCVHPFMKILAKSLTGTGTGIISESTDLYRFIPWLKVLLTRFISGTLNDTDHCEVIIYLWMCQWHDRWISEMKKGQSFLALTTI